MDLWQLHIFCKVVEQKSFSRAGQSVHLSQPTVSSHIRDLESHFDCKLIDRLGKEAVPTKAGVLLYRQARRLLRLRDEMETAMAEFQGSIRGHFTLGGSTIPGSYLLPQLIGEFRKRHPKVILSLKISDSSEILEEILDGDLEMGIIGALSSDRRAEQTCLLEDELGLLVPANHAWAKIRTVSLEELRKEPLILREKGSGTRETFVDQLKKQKFSIDDFTIAAEMGNTQAVIQAVKSEVGVSVLSPLAVEEEIQNGQLAILKIRELDLKRSFYLTRHRDRSPSPICLAFLAHIKGFYDLPEKSFRSKKQS